MGPTRIRREGERERREIIEALKDYPHSFQMKDMCEVRDNAFKSLEAHLQAGLESGYSTSLETARTRNLLAYALFRLNEKSEAVAQTDEVLKMDDQRSNIVSLANKAYMLSQGTELDDAKDIVSQLQKLKEDPDFEYLVVTAKAELATSYMRFGPQFNEHAANAFKEVIPLAREPEAWMWKFGLAVVYRQALGLQFAPYTSQREDAVAHKDAMKLLKEVLDSAGPQAASENLKANAHAEMALLLRSELDKTRRNKLGFEARTGPLASCKEALKLDNNDSSVLWKTGKLFRNYGDLFRSRTLLEKAVARQKSSPAYHHLGLTYKAMATSLKYGKLKTRRGGKAKQRRRARKEKRSQMAEGVEVPAVPDPGRKNGVVGSARKDREHKKGEKIKKMVKSPNGTTQFDPEDDNVQMAFKNLKLAVEFSLKENSRALYDLGLMHKATGNDKEALKCFKDIVDVGTSGVLEQVTALEQMGLLYQEMCEVGEEGEKKRLKEKSESMLYRALSRAAELYSSTAAVQHIFGKIFHSPSALLKAADASDCDERDKRKTKAAIFNLINDHKQSLALLKDIKDTERDAQFYKLYVESLSKGGEYDKATACIAMLKPTKQYEEVMELLEPHKVQDIFLQAGRMTLLEGACHTSHFTTAFRDLVSPPHANSQVECQSATKRLSAPPGDGACCSPTEVEASDEDSSLAYFYDIMLLHDDEDEDIEKKAIILAEILQTTCRLRVVRRHENVLEGAYEQNSITDNMDRSQLIVFLPGKKEILPDFEVPVIYAADRESTVVLLTDGVTVENIPRQLRTSRCRCLHCPTELFAPDFNPKGPFPEVIINAVCRLFKFLTNI